MKREVLQRVAARLLRHETRLAFFKECTVLHANNRRDYSTRQLCATYLTPVKSSQALLSDGRRDVFCHMF